MILFLLWILYFDFFHEREGWTTYSLYNGIMYLNKKEDKTKMKNLLLYKM